jgi:hypothetical protein
MLPIRTEYRATGHVKTGDRYISIFSTRVEGSEVHGSSERDLEGDKRA